MGLDRSADSLPMYGGRPHLRIQIRVAGFTGVRHRRTQIGEARQHSLVGLRADSAPKGTFCDLASSVANCARRACSESVGLGFSRASDGTRETAWLAEVTCFREFD